MRAREAAASMNNKTAEIRIKNTQNPVSGREKPEEPRAGQTTWDSKRRSMHSSIMESGGGTDPGIGTGTGTETGIGCGGPGRIVMQWQ